MLTYYIFRKYVMALQTGQNRINQKTKERFCVYLLFVCIYFYIQSFLL